MRTDIVLFYTHFVYLFISDMEAALESVGDVRRHPAHRGHQAPGR